MLFFSALLIFPLLFIAPCTASDFSTMPKLAALANGEKREVYYYETLLVIRDSAIASDEVHRCEVIDIYKEEDAQEMLSLLISYNPQNTNFETMLSIMDGCDSLVNIGSTKSQPAIWNGIFPKTKWCGPKNIAESYQDLGWDRNLDRCCRAHELCPIKIRKHDTRLFYLTGYNEISEEYSLKNSGIFTSNHCTCEQQFYYCLKSDNSWRAKVVSKLYFKAIKPNCIAGQPDRSKEKMRLVKTKDVLKS